MTNPTIQTDLAEILKDIKQSINSIDSRLNHLEVGQARLEEKFEAQERRLCRKNWCKTAKIVGEEKI